MEEGIAWEDLKVLMMEGPDDGLSIEGLIFEQEADYEGGVTDEVTARARRQGDRFRVDDLEGQPMFIFGAEFSWTFPGFGRRPTRAPRSRTWWGFSPQALLRRPDLERWEDDDFTQPRGPVQRVDFLGRDAWQVDLTPPAHKEPIGDLRLTVDAVTGLILSQRNGALIEEWTELRFGESHEDEIFSWAGPAHVSEIHEPDPSADHVAFRLQLVEGLLAALERHAEVTVAVAGSATELRAREALIALLGISDQVAAAVLDTQWRRMTRESRSLLHQELSELRARR